MFLCPLDVHSSTVLLRKQVTDAGVCHHVCNSFRAHGGAWCIACLHTCSCLYMLTRVHLPTAALRAVHRESQYVARSGARWQCVNWRSHVALHTHTRTRIYTQRRYARHSSHRCRCRHRGGFGNLRARAAAEQKKMPAPAPSQSPARTAPALVMRSCDRRRQFCPYRTLGPRLLVLFWCIALTTQSTAHSPPTSDTTLTHVYVTVGWGHAAVEASPHATYTQAPLS